ncbi:8203_t:CDS:2, partial [Racocetra persica]
KTRSIPALTAFLNDINCNTDPLVRIRSSAKIRVQVESVKCRKTIKGKKNDPHTIPACKVRAVGKKAYSLNKYLAMINVKEDDPDDLIASESFL